MMENSVSSPVSENSGRTMKKGSGKKVSPRLFFWMCLVTAVFIIVICPTLDPVYIAKLNGVSRPRDICSGKRVYMYDLPPQFNVQLSNRSHCDKGLIFWMDLCARFGNNGYGLKLWDDSKPQIEGEFDRSSWYDTDSYMLEVIFHKRMKQYHCLTEDPSVADAFFVPYYTGLLALVHLYPYQSVDRNGTLQHEMRKKFGMELITWLEENGGQQWRRYGGRDHFLVLGRTTWDFKFNKGWGTGFSALPHVNSMTRLLIEKNGIHENEQAIPYPTSFHPSSPERLSSWIAGVKSAERKFLFSYVGAPRPDIVSVRGILGSQCINAGKSVCKLVNCSVVKCSHDPESIYKAFLQSNFCLQPRGDSSTRRSTFDCLISGTIPVFFSADSAYTQYPWHLPPDHESYSVYISEAALTTEEVSIEEVLLSYSPEQIRKMREKIVSLIPSLIYNNYPNDPLSSRKDAFEVTVANVLERIAYVKKDV